MDGLLVWTVPASVARSNQAAKAFPLIFHFSLIVSQELVGGGEDWRKPNDDIAAVFVSFMPMPALWNQDSERHSSHASTRCCC